MSYNTKLKRIEHEFVRELGVSIENIVKTTEVKNIDLIVMATKGVHNPFGELWGTKTAKIIKSVKVPVLIFPDNTSLNTQSKIGLLCDYSREADYHTLDFLVEVAKRLGVDVDVITLNRNEKSMTTEEIAYKHLVRTQLEKVPSTFNFTFNNNVEEGVISYSKNNNIGLIAILPKSYSFIERLFHDSLTEQMAFHSHIPLLVLK